MDEHPWRDLGQRLSTFAVFLLAALIDAAFLVGWAALQYGVAWALMRLPLEGVDVWVLLVFRLVFAVATLAPVLAYVAVDVAKMARRAYREAREAPAVQARRRARR